MDAEVRIKRIFNESVEVKMQSVETLAPSIAMAAQMIAHCVINGNKVLVCGNGGSAASGQHFTSKFLNHFELERPSLPAIALTTDSSTITAIANDRGFNEIFSTQVRAIGQKGDVLITISTGGHSANILCAIDAAHDRQMDIIALSGRDGGELPTHITASDIEIRVPADNTARIQETHLLILHCLCDLIDHQLLGQGT